MSAQALGWLLGGRVVADLGSFLALPWLGTLVGAIGCGLLAWWARAGLSRQPARWSILVFIGLMSVAALHGTQAVRWWALLVSPCLALLAGSAHGPDRVWDWSRWIVLAACLSLVLAGWGVMSGQPSQHVINDYPRLLGGYANVHAHATALVVFISIGLLWAEAGRGWQRPVGALLCAFSWLVLIQTWVRTAMLMAAIVCVVYLARRSRLRWLLAGLAVGAGMVLASDGLQDRFSDVAAVMSGTAPAEGWLALGSWRVRIWIETSRGFFAHGPLAVVTGLGLGDHIGLHKHLGPHSDFLALLFQAGILAPLAWVAVVVTATAGTVQLPRDPIRDYALALGLAVLLTAGLSNDVLTRQTLAWWVFVVLGAASSGPGEEAGVEAVVTRAGDGAERA